MLEPYSPDILWLVIVGFLVAFVLAFGIGANDVANSFGTSVGSKVLTVRQACYLATVFEIAGAVLIGYKVSDTMRKDLLDISLYDNYETELMLGCLASLASSAVWLIVATFLKLPISGTHSIVGATVGFSLVCRGTQGLNWRTLGMIVASWFVSPVLSGVMSCLLFKGIHRWILESPQPLVPGLRAMPLFYGFTILVNVFSIVHNGPKLLYFDRIPMWGVYVTSISAGVLVAIFVQCFIVPRQRHHILEQTVKEKHRGVSFTFGGSTDSSREPSPRPSRNVSADDFARESPLPMIDEVSECQEKPPPLSALLADNNELVHFPSTNTSSQHTYRFNLPKEGPDTRAGNGYILAETALNNAISDPNGGALSTSKNGTSADSRQLHLPGSGQVTPAFGLSPNSSAVPLIREKVPESLKMLESGDAGAACSMRLSGDEPEEVSRIFSFLQVLTATFGSFAHGGNDVSNAIGPLIAIWLIYHDGSVQQRSETPISILLYGGVGISVGLWLWGRRVIQTIGEDLTKITASAGFTIEIGAAFTVLLASKIGLPISTTHCKVGSVVFVGFVKSSGSGVDWKLFRNIIYAWVVTVPVAAGLSAAFMATFRGLLL